MASKKDKKAGKPAATKPKQDAAAKPPPPAHKNGKRGADAPPACSRWVDAQIVSSSIGSGELLVQPLAAPGSSSATSLVDFSVPDGKTAPGRNGQFRLTLELNDDPVLRKLQIRDLQAMLDVFLHRWDVSQGIVACCQSTGDRCNPRSHEVSNPDDTPDE